MIWDVLQRKCSSQQSLSTGYKKWAIAILLTIVFLHGRNFQPYFSVRMLQGEFLARSQKDNVAKWRVYNQPINILLGLVKPSLVNVKIGTLQRLSDITMMTLDNRLEMNLLQMQSIIETIVYLL